MEPGLLHFLLVLQEQQQRQREEEIRWGNKKNCAKINPFYSNSTLPRTHQLNTVSGGKYTWEPKRFLKRIHLMFQRPQGALLKSLVRDTHLQV